MSAIHDWTPSNDSSASSLLSLSIAAANAAPIPLAQSSDPPAGSTGLTSENNIELNGNIVDSVGSLGSILSNGVKQHRRLSSTGKARRRLSDARDAATRPLPAPMQTATAALSLASLSLSTSLPTQGLSQSSTLFTPTSNSSALPSQLAPISITRTTVPNNDDVSRSAPIDDLGAGGVSLPSDSEVTLNGSNGNSGISTNGKGGKKKGTDHKCESCSKIYRHPSCLIKHRWEHTPHWREASKFVLSKHQQVQLLEAAAILSHLSPSSSTGTSLPEDRSLWPSFLSGGTLPLPSASLNNPVNDATAAASPNSTFQSSSHYAAHPTSSSMPAYTLLGSNRATSAGPRLHDYSIPAVANGSGGLTQLRPGLLGVPTGSGPDVPTSRPSGRTSDPQDGTALTGTLPVPVPVAGGLAQYRGRDGPAASRYGHAPDYSPAVSNSLSGGGGWSLARSVSGSSRSRSGSGSRSRSDDGSELVDGDVELEFDDEAGRQGYGFDAGGRGKGDAYAWKREEEEYRLGFSVREEDEDVGEDPDERMAAEEAWDGMEMDMDMD